MPHSSLHPCTWCDIPKTNLKNCGSYRTFKSCLENYEAWKRQGAVMKNAKIFNNCINPPVISASDNNTKILDIIPPPELHLVLGVVNTVMDDLLKNCEVHAIKYAKSCDAEREITHGGAGFKGGSCKKLLKGVNYLRSFNCFTCTKYVDVLQKFNDVVDDCFSMELKSSYTFSIKEFKKSYLGANLPVTPKVHAVFYHVEDFCKEKKKGLGFYCEQAVEPVHHDFDCTWSKHRVSENHHLFQEKLYDAVIDYNSNHL